MTMTKSNPVMKTLMPICAGGMLLLTLASCTTAEQTITATDGGVPGRVIAMTACPCNSIAATASSSSIRKRR